MIYNDLKYSHVVYTCKFCDKKWDFTSHFFMGDVLGNFARFLQIVHCVIHHRDKITSKDILDGLKCSLRAPSFRTQNNFDCSTSDCPLSFVSSFNFFIL